MFRQWTLAVLLGGNILPSTQGFVVRPTTIAGGIGYDAGTPSATIRTKDDCFLSPLVVLQSTTLPTVEELSTDPFMKQIGHAAEIVDLLSTSNGEEDDEALTKALTSQLSHSDGIRGFFVNYLTGEIAEDNNDVVNPADLEQIPKPLLQAMANVTPKDELISLSCMNVIMPTAMTTMHEDPSLAASSAKTAQRGTRILQSLSSGDDSTTLEKVRTTCKAIYEVAMAVATVNKEDSTTSDDNEYESDAKDIEYWEKFFGNWGYESQQKEDIALVMKDFIH